MAGVKGKSGGARTGAGRPKKQKPKNTQPEQPQDTKKITYELELEKAWASVYAECEKENIVLEGAKKEAAKGYCKAVATREVTEREWITLGGQTYAYNDRGSLVQHPLVKLMNSLGKTINERAKDIGFDIKIIKGEQDESSNKDDDDGMFE